MNADTVKAIKDALTPIANKLGQGAGHLYEVFTRQQYAYGIAELVWAAGLAIVAGAAIWLTVSLVKGDDEEYAVFPGVVALMGSLIALGLTASGIMHLLNPEYYAIQDIACKLAGHCNP